MSDWDEQRGHSGLDEQRKWSRLQAREEIARPIELLLQELLAMQFYADFKKPSNPNWTRLNQAQRNIYRAAAERIAVGGFQSAYTTLKMRVSPEDKP